MASKWGCNSTYRLRYAPKGARQQRSKATMRAAHRKCLSKAKVKRRWWSNSTYRLRYWNCTCAIFCSTNFLVLQQCLPFTVLKPLFNSAILLNEECCNSTYRLRYWNINVSPHLIFHWPKVATVLTVHGIETFFWKHRKHINRKLVATAYGMRRRVRDGRGAKRRWSPHISSTWAKRG